MTQAVTLAGLASTNTLYADSSGNVGIGVSNPSSYGILTAYSASNPTLTIASGNANAYLRLNTTSDSNMYLTNTGGSMTMRTANTERMRIDSLGNVGIGTSSPSSYGRLAVMTPTATYGYFGIANSSSGGGGLQMAQYYGTTKISYIDSILSNGTPGSETAGLAFATASVGTVTERMRIDSAGNVGIGTSAPIFNLDVYKSSAASIGARSGGTTISEYAQVICYANSNQYYVQNLVYGNGLCSTAASPAVGQYYQTGTISATPVLFLTNNTERMRIDSSGNLLVGTTSAILTTAKLTVSTTGSAGIVSSTSSNVNLFCVNANNTSWSAISFRYNTSTEVGHIDCTSTATTYTSGSDYRLKESVTPMIGGLDKIMLLNPVDFIWKINNSKGQGFIAHELQEHFPDAVTGEKDAFEIYTDKNGIEQSRPKYQGVDPSKIVGALTAAIQELKAIIDTQQEQINSLLGK